MEAHVFFGQIIHSKSFEEMEIFTDGFIAVFNGTIIGIGHKNEFKQWKTESTHTFLEEVLNEHQFIMPGLIDCHIHAPQVPNIGLGMDKPLLQWLDCYTFPMESKYSDCNFAKEVYNKVVSDCIKSGTTTACYFATIHVKSSKILVNECLEQGQRAFVGKVSMNQHSPDFYVETTNASLKGNEEFINYILNQHNDLVQPIITPRFAISCDEELMKGLAQLANKFNLPIQSHISENLSEIAFVKELYPNATNYANVYEQSGLLTRNTIMAHCVHMEDEEIEIFKNKGTAAIHCPTSNTNLLSGLCDVKRLLSKNITVGLGTDVAGGNKLGILDVMRHALNVSAHLKFIKTQEIKGTGKIQSSNIDSAYEAMNYKNVLYLATLGGAKALSLENKVGNFVVGKAFDALIVDTSRTPILNYNVLKVKHTENELLNQIQKFVYVGDDRNITKVFVNGRLVKNI